MRIGILLASIAGLESASRTRERGITRCESRNFALQEIACDWNTLYENQDFGFDYRDVPIISPGGLIYCSFVIIQDFGTEDVPVNARGFC